MLFVSDQSVAQMPNSSGSSGDVVTAPTVFHKTTVVNNESAHDQTLPAVGCCEHAPDHHARYAEAGLGDMTSHATVVSRKHRLSRLRLVKRIEDDALLRIMGRN